MLNSTAARDGRGRLAAAARDRSNVVKPCVLMLTPYYLPGYKAGGPVWSLSNLVEALGDEFDFRIITADRDLDEAEPYPGVSPEVWAPVGNAEVLYLPPTAASVRRVVSALRDHLRSGALLYINGLFPRLYSMLPLLLRLLRLVPRGPVVLAPRGELSPGTLAIKRNRKAAYLALAKWIGLTKSVIWHASTQQEAQHLCRRFGSGQRVIVAADLPHPPRSGHSACGRKVPGKLRIVYLSRISREKNLLGALRMLKSLSGEVQFDIYGPIHERRYWQNCQEMIARLPANILVRYLGEVAHDRVHLVLSQYHIFLLPTLGENYGHAIVEALVAGCPAVISDQTPWRGLAARGAGWDIPLDQPARFEAALQSYIDAGPEVFEEWSRNAQVFGAAILYDPTVIEANRRLFEVAMARAPEVIASARGTAVEESERALCVSQDSSVPARQ